MKQVLLVSGLVCSLSACYLPSPREPAAPIQANLEVRLEFATPASTRPSTLTAQVGERISATVVLSNLTDQPLVLSGTRGAFYHLSALEIDGFFDPRDPARDDLARPSPANALVLSPLPLPPFSSSRDTVLELWLAPNEVRRARFEVWFSQPGAFLVRGAVRFELGGGEVIVFSRPELVLVR